MIYGRTGQPVTIKRLAQLEDIKRLEKRRPDKQDRAGLASGSLVIVDDHGEERLYHQAYLRADGGSREIGAALGEEDCL